MVINDLFAYIRMRVGCDYISDIRYGSYKTSAIIVLRQLDKSQIEPKQYTDICQYLGI